MPENPKQNSISDVKEKVSNLSKERKWAMSCYIPVFNIVICILASIRMIHDKFVLYHARQGLVLFGFWIVTLFISLVFGTISLMLLGIVLMLHVICLIHAYKMKTTAIPLVADLVNKIPEDYIFKKLTGKAPEKDSDTELGKNPENQEVNKNTSNTKDTKTETLNE